MQAAHRGQVGIGEDVAIEHEERARGQVGGAARSAARSEWLVLHDVPEPHAETLAVAECGADVIHAIRARQHAVRDAVRA